MKELRWRTLSRWPLLTPALYRALLLLNWVSEFSVFLRAKPLTSIWRSLLSKGVLNFSEESSWLNTEFRGAG